MNTGNIQIVKDKKSECYFIYKIDNEGFHHSLQLTYNELRQVKEKIQLI